MEEISDNIKLSNKDKDLIVNKECFKPQSAKLSNIQKTKTINMEELFIIEKKEESLKDEPKKETQETISPAKNAIILKENKNEDDMKKEPRIEGLGDITETELNNNHKKKNSEAKIGFGPEIFVHMKTQNILENYSVGQFLGKGEPKFWTSLIK